MAGATTKQSPLRRSNSATGGDWPVSDLVLNKLVALCVDVCERNGIPSVTFTGDKNGTLKCTSWYAQHVQDHIWPANFQWISRTNKYQTFRWFCYRRVLCANANRRQVQGPAGAFGDKSNADRHGDQAQKEMVFGKVTYMVNSRIILQSADRRFCSQVKCELPSQPPCAVAAFDCCHQKFWRLVRSGLG